MAEYRLYCFAQSGNAYKAALMLALCQADWEARFVDYFNGETRTPDYTNNINEMGEVPVLDHGGRRMAQSGVILDYLAEQLGRFGARDPEHRREILRWLLFDNHKLTSYTATLRFMLHFGKVGDTPVTAFLRERSEKALAVLEARLAEQDFVTGAEPSIADISLCGYLYFPDEFGVTWESDYPAIGRWLQRIATLPGWAHPYELMPGHPLPEA